MPSGRLGSADLAAVTNTTLYTVPVGTVTAGEVTLCNRTAVIVNVSIALSTTATPTLAEWVLFNLPVAANNMRGYKFPVLEAGANVVVSASAVGISAMISGWEEVA